MGRLWRFPLFAYIESRAKGKGILQHTRALVIIVALVVTGLTFACIPPPAATVPNPSTRADSDVPRCVLDAAAAVTLSALPGAGAGPAAASLMMGISTLAQNASPEADAAATDGGEPTPRGNELADTARQFKGVRYRWAGMSSRGMDCSGLVARVLRANGIRAPHNAAGLFKLGKPVRFEELQPGDLLFFKTSRRGISHVGMYVGDDKFIHASSGAGRVVTTSIYDPYYSQRLKGARRLGHPAE
jgi:cell wall-associated NlpC family hydrolase